MTRVILTAFYPDTFFVPLWERYYLPHFDDACMLAIQPGAYDFAGITAMLNARLPELLKKHDLVMIADIDEIIVPDPDKWRDLGGYLDHSTDDVIRCVGYNVMQMPWDEALDLDRPLTEQRMSWQRDRLYDKPVITRVTLRFTPGNHLCDRISKPDPDLVMFHLRDADIRRTFIRRGTLDNAKSRAALLRRMAEAIEIPERWRVI